MTQSSSQHSAQSVRQNLKQIQTEAGQHSQKIGQIFRSAFVEAGSEFKAGARSIRPLAKSLADTTLDVVKEKGQAVNTNVRQALKETPIQETDSIARLQRQLQVILKAIKETLFSNRTATVEPPLSVVSKVTTASSEPVMTIDAQVF